VSDLQQDVPRLRREFRPPAKDDEPRRYFRDPERGGALTLVSDRAVGGRPLVVDLDGTLVRSDLLIETSFSELARRPHSVVDMTRALARGKAALKHRLSEPVDFDPAILPYDEEVLRRIHEARAQGRRVYLASASHERLVSAIADHLEVFDGWFATDETTNCAGAVKAQKLVAAFGERGFDYIGNDAADLAVWPHAARAIAIRASSGVARKLEGIHDDVEHLACDKPDWKCWAKQLRVHQYAKNALVFVPLLAAEQIGLLTLLQVFLAALAFSLCASGVYILNDLLDLQDDRGHRTKRLRPLASGTIPLSQAMLAVPVLLLVSGAIAAAVSLPFLAVLVGYFALTTAYSLYLKRKMFLDVLVLACLYTVRVIGGAVALGVSLSPWFLAFFLAWFLSLALVKRYVELAARREAKQSDPKSRDYKNDDVDMVGALAAAAGFNAITIFALYASSDMAHEVYRHPELLWLVGPVLTYWMGRTLMLARRGSVHDDPVVFALKDRVSLGSLAVVGVLMFAAM